MVDAVNTNETVFFVNGSSYQPLDFAYFVDQPNVTGFLNETIICLE